MENEISIIDTTLKVGLERRGLELAAEARRRRYIFSGVFVFLTVALGFVVGLLGLVESFDALMWFVTAVIFGVYAAANTICMIPVRRATRALDAGLIERATVLTDQALNLSVRLFPVSFLTMGNAIDVKFRLMLSQSRFVEVEALTYLLLTTYKKYRRFGWDNRIELFLKNYCAIALLGQLRYDEAKKLFVDCLESTRAPANKKLLLNNIGHCEFELGQLDLACATLAKAIAVRSRRSRTDDKITAHIQYNLARSLTKSGQLPQAELAAQMALELGQSSKALVYTGGHCYVAVGELRMAQGELEEAEQHIRSGLETMHSRFAANNPNVIRTTRLLASLLEKLGRTKEAGELLHTADMAEVSLQHQVERDIQQIAKSINEGSIAALIMKN